MSIKKKTNIIFIISVILTAIFLASFYYIRTNLFDSAILLYEENNIFVLTFHTMFLIAVSAIIISKIIYKKHTSDVTDAKVSDIYSSRSPIRMSITLLVGIAALIWCLTYFIENKDSLSILMYFYLPCGILSGIYFILLAFPAVQKHCKLLALFPPIWISLGLVIEFIDIVNKAYTKSFIIELVGLIVAAVYLIGEARFSLGEAKFVRIPSSFVYSLAAGMSLLTWSVPCLIVEIANSALSASTVAFYIVEALVGIYCFMRGFIISETEI